MFGVQGLSRAEVHRNAVLNDSILFQNLVEDAQRPAAIDYVVLRYNFEPVDNRFSLQNVPVVRYPQADDDPVISESIESICRHGDRILFKSRLAPSTASPAQHQCKLSR